MDDFRFSVSMCVYGKDDPEHFRIALYSVYRQTLLPDEVVLVVDGPVPEETEAVIKSFGTYPGFKVFRLLQNMGHGIARMTGLKHCSLPYVAIADADDINLPDRFKKQINAFKKDPELSVLGGALKQFIGAPDNVIATSIKPTEDAEIKRFLRTHSPIAQTTAMFRKADVMAVGGYLDWYCAEDYYLWLRLYLAGCKFGNLQNCLVYVRVSEAQYRRRGGWRFFNSTRKLFGFMLKNKIIGLPLYIYNVAVRFVLQILLPTKLRGWIRKKYYGNKKID